MASLRFVLRSGVLCFLTPGNGNRFFRIPNPCFCELGDNFLGRKLCNSVKIDPNFCLGHFKTIINFVKFVATKKGLSHCVHLTPRLWVSSAACIFQQSKGEILFTCVQAAGEVVSSLKGRTSSSKMKFINLFSSFVGHLCPPSG
jgi:hypothetical protein